MTNQCPSDEDLAAYAEGAFWSPEERSRIEAHLLDCSTCREIAEFVIRMKETQPELFARPPRK